MPLIEAGFITEGVSDNSLLITLGPTIQVLVAYHPKNEDSTEKEQKIKNAYALIDTGAMSCMIDDKLAQELGLIKIDKVPVAGVSGSSQHFVYMGAILIPQLNINQFGKFLGANLKEGGISQEVLLGRDILKNTIMIYDGFRAQVTIASAVTEVFEEAGQHLMQPQPVLEEINQPAGVL